MRGIIFTIILLSAIMVPKTAESETLLVSFGNHNAEPYAFVENKRLVGGIIREIMDELGEKFGTEIRYMNIPRKRIAPYLLSGSVHVNLISNPCWMENPEQYQWSVPLFEESDIFVMSAKRAFPITAFDDLYGKRLGTILGYHYPGLTEKFDRQEIFRDDVRNLDLNFKKLERDRIDCLIDSNILVDYYLKKYQAYDKFVIAEAVASTHNIQAMFSQHLPVSFDRINAAFQQLQETGRIQKILDKYTDKAYQ